MQHFVSKFLEPSISFLVPSRLVRLIVNPAVYFDNQPDFRTIKVDNVPVNWNLTAELQAECFSISQQVPNHALGSRVFSSHLTRSVGEQFRELL
jgi:hypothetical protein